MVSRRDRGQLILIAGVVIALLVFGIVMLLNSMLFVNNAAPHQASKNMEDGSAYRVVVEDDLQRIVDETAGSERYVRSDELRPEVSTYDQRMSEVAAETAPSYLDVEFNEGSSDVIPLLIQDTAGKFESDSDGYNWRMFEDGHVEEFEMGIEPNSYAASNKFRLVATDDDEDVWVLSVSKESNYPVVETTLNGNPQTKCKGNTKKTSIEIDMNSVTMPDGPSCAISFANGLDDSYSLEVEKGNQIETTYRILIDGTVETAHTDGRGSPHRVDAVTSAAFDLQYDTPQISYKTTITDVRPNGATLPSTPPTASFIASTLQPSVGADVTFDASVSTDDDGVIDEYRWDIDGDGTAEKRGEIVTASFSEPGVHEVKLTIEDNDGKTTTTTKTVYPYLALNAQGEEITSDTGVKYIPDHSYADGGSSAVVRDDIDSVSEPNVYQTERYGNFGHEIELPNGHYVVKLQFAEIWWGGNDRTGTRVFDVDVEGATVINDLNIYSEVGHDAPLTLTYTVEVTDGELNIDYVTEVDNAKISAVVIRSEESP